MAGVPLGYVRINFNAEQALAARLDERAHADSTGKAAIIRKALEAYLRSPSTLIVDLAPAAAAEDSVVLDAPQDPLALTREGLRRAEEARTLARLQEIGQRSAPQEDPSADPVAKPNDERPEEEEVIDPRLA